MKKWFVLAGLLLVTAVPATASVDDSQKFPHRAKFKNVVVIDGDQLHKDFDSFIIVDVRSRYEYDTLHIKGALHIELNKTKFPAAVRELRANSPKPIVFYCNGTTCKKSYEAAELAMNAGISDVRAYDAGLDAWTTQYPDLSTLLGRSPVQASDLISQAEYKKRLISGADFDARMEKGAVVLDIRDLRQRDVALYPMRELRAPLDDSQKIADAVAEAKKTKKLLLVYDKVGKQTRWFQYYLEKQGVKEYYFLDGGAEAYYEARYGKLQFKQPDPS